MDQNAAELRSNLHADLQAFWLMGMRLIKVLWNIFFTVPNVRTVQLEG